MKKLRVVPSWDYELEKITESREEGHSDELGMFLEWTREIPNGEYRSINDLLEEYFGVDTQIEEQQKRMLLDYIRWRNVNETIV